MTPVSPNAATLRQLSLSESTDSSLNDADADVDENPSLLDKNGISRIFYDAVCYSEAISEENDGEGPSGEHAAQAHDTGSDSDTESNSDAVSVRRFANLVGRDLSHPNLAASERFAKITVNSFPKDGGVLYSPETDVPELDGKTPVAEEPRREEGPTGPLDTGKDEAPLPPTRSSSISQLAPEEIVKLLADEFGTLSTSDSDEERLIFERDGAYFQEIAILGMIHLTTHRLTFHASLLSTRPDLLPDKQVIKTGPATVHIPGRRKKRRLWLELSHDMFTSFPSGKAEDRIRPIRSVLLSSIKRVLPEDPNNRKIVKATSTADDNDDRYVEFDTEESAREWRRELQGAIYLYRHRRAGYLARQPEDDTNGVRINIPLSRVKSFSTRKFLKFATVISIVLDTEKVRSGMQSSLDHLEDEDGNDEGQSSDEEKIDIEGRTLEIGVTQLPEAWKDFGEMVEKAKRRERETGKRVSSKVTIDFGALSFVEQREETRRVEDDKEEAIRNALSLGLDDEIWYTRSRISRSIASSGYFVITNHYVGFWTKCFSIMDAKYRYPISRVLGARQNYRYRPRTFGMILDIKEHQSQYFDFASQELRDEVIRRISAAVETYLAHVPRASTMSPPMFGSALPSSPSRIETFSTAPLSESPPPMSSPLPSMAGVNSASGATATTQVLSPLSHIIDRLSYRVLPHEALPLLPKVINLPAGVQVMPRTSARHFVCLTIGSRGDVQPYIALAQELLRGGHSVTIVTHAEYKEWIEGWGIRHRPAGGDPGALMKLSVEHKMFSPQFFKESLSNFRTWLDDLLVDAWEQCKDADVLLESPSAMAGVHIAEALNIPYFRTFTMPWTKTAEFPHPFLSPPVELASFNTSTFILFDNMFWSATSGQINRWRRNTLHIGNTDMGHLAQSKIPFIYNFSSFVVPKPLDWGDAVIISGYWFLDNPDLGWTPPESLTQWICKARDDGKPIVYIGFGSITVPNPPAMTRSIVKAVLKSDVRAIISKGWSARMSKLDEQEFIFPPECYPIDKIPHDWLFPQVDAALHHGGAGTTGASLRAGIPTLIKPWFGDQFFWASRVQKLGAGMKVSSLHSSELASALVKATSDRLMRERAASIGENIRSEHGVQAAVRAIYTYLDRAGRDRTELD
ncbi:hypothetical protein M0805_002477 [Coniferiporia weirii]|nr:hypothetical protein M0805_002477 [Coniferiporia weirii]